MRNSLLWIRRGARLALFAILALAAWVAWPVSPSHAGGYGDIVVSEIMYDPADAGDLDPNEWVELYNPTDAAIDVGGWVLTDDDTWPYVDEGICTLPTGVPAQTTIPSLGFLVVSKTDLSSSLGIANLVQCTETGAFQLANATTPPGDNLALYNGSAPTSEIVFGNLGAGSTAFNYPDLTSANTGRSIGLKNPTAGWSGNRNYWENGANASHWILETDSIPDPAPFTQHTAGAANTGWANYMTTPHTISVDGTVNTSGEWLFGELLGRADSMVYYVSWDADYLYVGMVGADATAGNDSYNVLLDVDPYDVGLDNAGTQAEFCGATFGEQGKPDFAIQVSGSGLATQQASGGAWTAWSPADSSASVNGLASGNAEFRIRKSDLGLGSADAVGLYLYGCNNAGRVRAAWPPENEINTTSVVAQTTRTVFDSTGERRSPREDAAHLGYETLMVSGPVNFFDRGGVALQNWHVRLNVQTAPVGPCEITIKVLANTQVTRLSGGVRRSYTITPTENTPATDDECYGINTWISLKYEQGASNNQTDTQTDVDDTPSELRGLDEGAMTLYRYNGATWVPYTGGVSTPHNRIYATGVTSFSAWSFGYTGHTPTLVHLSRFEGHSPASWGGLVGGVAAVGLGLLLIRRRRKNVG